VKRRFSELTVLLIALLGVLVLMWIFNGADFMNIRNLQSMAFQMPELGILSLAMMIAMLTAGINLSIIATANLSGIVMAYILTSSLAPEVAGGSGFGVVLLAILAGLLVAVLIGLLNGFLVAVLDISPILATLGTMIMVSGFSIVLTRGYVLSGFPPAMLFIGNGVIFGIPIPILVFIACAAVMSVILNHSALGTRIYLIGSNPTACFFSGVNNKAVLIRTYIISGLYAGIAAIVMISRFNSAKADYGESYLLMTVLASVLGGVSAAGGFGRVSGLVVALIILQFISSGLNLLGVSNFLTIALWGSVLILVMIVQHLIAQYNQKRRATWNIS
jgi:simple sugar transport system permease protein